MTRYEFLARAHEIIKPKVYLEIGVQYGGSLALAEAADLAIGIDPHPMVATQHQRANQQVCPYRSADWLDDMARMPMRPAVDMAFIDGSHLFEDALADFIGVERLLAGPRSIVFFDDVLPYSQEIAARTQPPGDWTGDVWKVAYILGAHRPDVQITLIDVAPTGLLMVESEYWSVRPRSGESNVADVFAAEDYDKIVAEWLDVGDVVPYEIVGRTPAVDAETVLGFLTEGRSA